MIHLLAVEYFTPMMPEEGVVAIPHGNSEDDFIPSLQRALPPPNEETMALAIETPHFPEGEFHILLKYLIEFQ